MSRLDLILDGICLGLNNTVHTPFSTVVKSYTFWVNGVLYSAVILFGVLTIPVTCFVLTRNSLRARINPYLIALGCWDFALLICSLFLYPLQFLRISDYYQTNAGGYCLMVFYPLANVTRTASIHILIASTVERFIAICYPMLHQRISTARRTYIVIFTVGVFAVLFNIPRFFELTVRHCQDLGFGYGPYLVAAPTALRINNIHYWVYHVIMAQIFLELGPFIVQLTLSIMIAYNLHKTLGVASQFSTITTTRDAKSSGRRKLGIFSPYFILRVTAAATTELITSTNPDLPQTLWIC